MTKEVVSLDKKTIIAELVKSPHGDLREYLSVGRRAVAEDPDFFAHLVAWNHLHGQVRDAKSALPIIALAAIYPGLVEHAENALAHIADLNPKMLGKALLPSFDYTVVTDPKNLKRKQRVYRLDPVTNKRMERPSFARYAQAPTRVLRRLVARYLWELESDPRVERTFLQHHRLLHELHAHYRVPIASDSLASQALFHGTRKGPRTPAIGAFMAVRQLKNLTPDEVLEAVTRYKIPFIVAQGALYEKAKDTRYVLALMKAMSSTELITNMRWLESVGVKTDPALRAQLEESLGKAALSTRGVLKTSVAAKALEGDERLTNKLQAVQEKQLDRLGGIDGDWLVLADKSGSMDRSIEVARIITATLARSVKGRVHLIFFDSVPYHAEVTGKTLEEITEITRNVRAGGGTHMHCGVRAAMDNKIHVDGMVFIGDGANHGPKVPPHYQQYCEKMGVEPTLYFYSLPGEPDTFTSECSDADLDLQTFDLRGSSLDYHSLPNLVQTMRVSRYSLVEEIMATPLRTLDEVLTRTIDVPVLPRQPKVVA